MRKSKKENDINFFYAENGQSSSKDIKRNQKRKLQEREKRIKEKQKSTVKTEFDSETETVINMTNRNKIKKEEQRRKEISKKQQKRNKRNKKIKFILKLILLIGVIGGTIAFAMISPIFNIKEINVSGNSKISYETIVSLSELKTDENIFRFNKSDIIKKIKENSYVENVKINRKIPNKIQIEIEERVARYSVEFMGKYAYINSQGYILEITEDAGGYPIILGVETKEEEIEPNKRLINSDLEKLEDVIKIMNVAKENGLDTEITNINIANKNEYSILLENKKKKINIGDNSNLSNKMIHIVAILEAEKDKEGEIFVNGDLNNKFRPYFKEKV